MCKLLVIINNMDNSYGQRELLNIASALEQKLLQAYIISGVPKEKARSTVKKIIDKVS